MPPGDSNSDVDFTGIKTIPQLAVATRLQEYKDLIGASGSRYSDWLYTFFASKIEHVTVRSFFLVLLLWLIARSL